VKWYEGMRAKYYWLEMHPSRGTCLLVVHVDCCLSEATCYSPAHSSSLLRSSHHHHININFFLAMVLLKHYFLDVTQKPLSRKRFLWKLLGFSLQTLHFSVDRKSWTAQARHSVYRSNMNNKTCTTGTGRAGTVFTLSGYPSSLPNSEI
jgi:hypothetical protein